jgi:hypothetical protein
MLVKLPLRFWDTGKKYISDFHKILYLQNGFMDPEPPVFSGLCVECETDCDCGVNQYCGIDKDRVCMLL